MRERRKPPGGPLLGAALAALLAGLWGGLLRVGWSLPAPLTTLPAAHGPLMVCGFLGVLIGLERAVALGRRWSYAAPALAGLGTLALLVRGPGPEAASLMVFGSLVLTAVSVVVIRLQPLPFTTVMGLGSLAWLGGNLLWLAGRPLHELVIWWVGFPTLTVAGERLQLSRILGRRGGRGASFAVVLAALLAGIALSSGAGRAIPASFGWRLAGAGLVGLAAWLLVFDIARRGMREPGLRRFIGVCLLSGYGWLGVAGLFALLGGAVSGGPRYDAFLHALFLGFVFALIFGHAPVVLPAIAGKRVPFHRSFYGHLLLLDASLILRIAGDLAWWPAARRWGALLNAAALLLFPLVTAAAVRWGAVNCTVSAVIPGPRIRDGESSRKG